MTKRTTEALEMYAADPVGAAQALQGLMEEDTNRFVRASALLLTEPDKPGFETVMKILAGSAGVAQQLGDPDLLDKQSSIDLAQRIAAIDPELDRKLVQLLPGRGVDGSDPAKARAVERILELLDAITASNRLVPMLAHLVRHPNTRLRAKVSLLIARWTGNVRAAEDRLDEPDSRMRANAVEALWGNKSSRATSVLWRALKDVDNRVVGNALFGLYELRDPNIIPCILDMAAHEKPRFRATAAWTMGQTGDPQFLPALEKLTHDLYAAVRKSAAKGIEQIRKREVPAAVPENPT